MIQLNLSFHRYKNYNAKLLAQDHIISSRKAKKTWVPWKVASNSSVLPENQATSIINLLLFQSI